MNMLGAGQTGANGRFSAAEAEAAAYVQQGNLVKAVMGDDIPDGQRLLDWVDNFQIDRKTFGRLLELKKEVELHKHNQESRESRSSLKEINRHRNGFRSKIWKIFKWRGLGTLLGGIFFGGSLWGGKKALEYATGALPAATEKIIGREFGERAGELQKQTETMKKMIAQLAQQIFAFIAKLTEKVSSPEFLIGVVSKLGNGLMQDASEVLSDQSLDKTMTEVNQTLKGLTDDHELGTMWAQIMGTTSHLRAQKVAFDATIAKATSVTQQDKDEAVKDYKAEIWAAIQEDIQGIPGVDKPSS